MAASMKQICLTLCRRKSSLFSNCVSTRRCLPKYASFTTKADQSDDNNDITPDEIEEEINKLRDVSNLYGFQRDRFLGIMPDTSSESSPKYFRSRKFLRKRYAELGAASGVNPSILWPSKGELDELVEVEKDWEPSFQQLVARVQGKQEAVREDQRRRDEKVEKSMAKMDELIKQFHEKQKKGVETDKKHSERTEELLDEFRQKYGYSVTPDVGKFRLFRTEKLEEEKLAKKKRKKEARKEKAIQALKDISAKSTKTGGS